MQDPVYELRVHPRLLRSVTSAAKAWSWLAIAAVFLATLAGCGGRSPAPTSTPAAPSITAQEVVLRSAESMKGVRAFRFRLSHSAGSTVLSSGISLDSAEGAAAAPDRLQVTADASFGRSFVKLSAIVIGDEAWVTNPLTGGWLKAPPGGSPFSTFDPGQLVAGILAGVTEVRFTQDRAPAGGRYRVSGKAGATILEPLVGEVDSARTVEFDLQIDASTFRLARAEIRGAVSEAEDPTTARVVDLFDFDAGIEIKPPI